MAQQRLRNYKNSLGSFQHNLANLGIHLPGRFCGFDNLISGGGLAFSLGHDKTGTGFHLKDASNVDMGPLGIIMTNQGVIVIENAIIPGFIVDTNNGNANYRIDMVVMNHQFTNIAGGAPATYSIIKGPMDASIPSPLATPDFQTIVGYLQLPPGATDLSAAAWLKARCPDSGDGLDARLSDVNAFTKNQQFARSTGNYTAPTDTSSGGSYWALNDDGNTFVIAPPTLQSLAGIKIGVLNHPQPGTIIILNINQNVAIHNIAIDATMLGKGYTPIVIPGGMENKMVTVNSIRVPSINPPNGNSYNVVLLRGTSAWEVVSIGGYYSSTLKYGMVVECDLPLADLPDYLNSDGSGKGIYLGYQCCTGINGTIDRRGYVGVMAGQDAPIFSGAPVANYTMTQLLGMSYALSYGVKDGEPGVIINDINMIPDHTHPIPVATTPGGGTSGGRSATLGPDGISGLMSGRSNGSTVTAHRNMMPYICTIYMQRVV